MFFQHLQQFCQRFIRSPVVKCQENIPFIVLNKPSPVQPNDFLLRKAWQEGSPVHPVRSQISFFQLAHNILANQMSGMNRVQHLRQNLLVLQRIGILQFLVVQHAAQPFHRINALLRHNFLNVVCQHSIAVLEKAHLEGNNLSALQCHVVVCIEDN